MARKIVKPEESVNIEEIEAEAPAEEVTVETVPAVEVKAEEVEATPVVEEVTVEEATPVVEENNNKQKYATGSIVFLTKDASADLNGFKLFPQYKKYSYTVESYDAETDVYTLRRLNLVLRLNSQYLLAPSERAHDPLNRKQY